MPSFRKKFIVFVVSLIAAALLVSQVPAFSPGMIIDSFVMLWGMEGMPMLFTITGFFVGLLLLLNPGA